MEKIGYKPENIQFRLKNKISLPLTGAFLDSIINMTCTALRSFISPHCDNERAICMKINELKHVPVGYVNTPLEYMPALTKKLGKGKLYIKRDDMTGLALGGNKARKLDYIVKYALDNGYTALMTFGGNQTNHGRLTVAAAIRYGLKPILILKGSKPEYMSGNVLLDRLMGADIYFVDTSAADALPEAERNAAKKKFVDACAEKVIAEYAARGEKVLSVPVGGQTVVGSAGYVQTVPEIMRQMEAQGIDAKYLVVGYGSTGTFAGLWAGAKYYNAPFEVIGIPIEPDYRPVAETVDFINELSRTFELGITCKEEDLHIEYGEGENFYGGVGYNEPDHITQDYIELMARTEAIFLDPCYTGKVFHGFVDLVRKGIIPDGEGAIMVHTGGAPGLWTKEHLDSMQEKFWANEEKDCVHVMEM